MVSQSNRSARATCVGNPPASSPRQLAIAIALVLAASSAATRAAPPPDAVPPPLAGEAGTQLLDAPLGGVGCHGITVSPRGISLCDGNTHALPDGATPGTTWDVVRVGYGTTATFNGYSIVSEIPTSGAGFFSPITVFSGPDGSYAVATGTFNNTTIYMAPQALANVIGTTKGVVNLTPGTNIGLNPSTTYSPTMTLAALAAFGGGVVNANGTQINLPTTLATAFQVTNSDPGGGLPGLRELGQINATNVTVTLGNGVPGTARTRGALVAGEAELNLTDSTVTAGNYALGIYNYFGGTYTGAINGSRSNVLRSTFTLGNDSVGWWGNGTLAPARLTATDSQFTVGTDSWGIYMTVGTSAQLTNTVFSAGANSYGANMDGGGTLTMAGTSRISAAGAGAIGIENDASHVVFAAGTPVVEGGELGITGLNAATFELQSGSSLTVRASEPGTVGIALDASSFAGVAGSGLSVAVTGTSGTGITVANAATLDQAGSATLTGPATAVSVTGSGSRVTLGGGGSASTSAGSASANAPVVFVDDAATFSATNLAIGSAGAQDAWGLLASNSAQATLAGGSVTTIGTASHAVAASLGGMVALGPNTTVTTSGTGSAGLAALGGTLNATGTTVSATGADAPALLLADDASSAQFSGGALANASGGTISVTGSNAVAALSDTQVGGSGQWLDVAAGGAGVTLTATRSTLTGSALTASDSLSDVTLVDSTWFLTGSSNLGRLVNDPSLIDFAPPTGDPSLLSSYKTLTVNNYSGDGTLAMNTWLAADDSPSDRLVIVNGTGSGPGTIQVRGTGGGGALTTADGILLVQAVNATTTTNAFALAGPVLAGPYEYFLYRGGAGGGGSTADVQNSWYLRSTLDCSAAGAPSPPCPSPPPPPPPPPGPPPPPTPPPAPPTPAYRQEVSLAAAIPTMAALYGRALIDTLHERVGDEHLLRQREDLDPDRTGVNGAWVRVLHHDGKRDGGSQGIYGTRGPGFDYDFDALQIGLDLYRGMADDGARQHAGGYMAYGQGKGEVRHNYLDYDFHAGTDRFDARTLGAYWTGFKANGAYLDAVAQYTWYDLRARSTRLPDTFTNGDGVAVSLEGGWPFALGSGSTTDDPDGWRLEPQAQVIWQKVDIDDLVDGIARVRYSDGDSTVGRLGVRLNRLGAGARSSDAWLRANVWHAFNGEPRTEFSSATGYVPFAADLGDTWAEVGIGGTWQVSQTGYLFADVDYTWSFDGDESAWNGKLGMRWNW